MVLASMPGATLQIYRQAARATGRSFRCGWLSMAGLVVFALIFVVISRIAAPLGLAGGFLLGAANALLVGATLRLIEQSLGASRTLRAQDIVESVGHYFWDVIGVGFVLWLPVMALDMSTHSNPYGQFLSYACLFLLFVLLNPAPEVIYQVRHDSPLDVFKTSVEFVIENWIEWFLPFAVLILPVVLSPSGLQEFLALSSHLGRGAGLDFFQLLILPFTVIGGWFSYFGLSQEWGWLPMVLLTPPVAMAILLFRGHLFALLHGTSRRQRLFQQRSEGGR